MSRNPSHANLRPLMYGLALLWALAGSPAAAGDPVYWPDNPSCADLGYGAFELKIESGFAGIHDVDGLNTVTVVTGDDVYFDWSSTLAMDAVIVKGGPNANAWEYDPESYGDSGLSSPINPNTGRPYGLSHISFCYDYEVVVEKSAETSFTRTWEWNIAKAVNPGVWSLFDGDTGTGRWDVEVTRTGRVDSDWAVSGTISIYNPAPDEATVEGVSDTVSSGLDAAVDCGGLPAALESGATLYCTYGRALPDGTPRQNVAVVETSGPVGGGSATAAVTFGEPTTEVHATVHVVDSGGYEWDFSDTGQVWYEQRFDCAGVVYSGGHGQFGHGNVAVIEETGQQASADVTVHCYRPAVEKDALTSFGRTFDWTIEKWGAHSELVLSPGQQYQMPYEVTVTALDPVDDDWRVRGTVAITNPNPARAALLASVEDVVSGGFAATVDCEVAFPYALPSGQTLECSYETGLPDGSLRTNRATARFQSHDLHWSDPPVATGLAVFGCEAAVDFAGAEVTEIDRCVDVHDARVPADGFLGTVCYEASPTTFPYSFTIGPYEAPNDCVEQVVDNTCTCIGHDTLYEGSDDWRVIVDVRCEEGCTLTPGYWKTHSEYGPAPYDDTWASLPVGADTPFFDSGQTYHQVLWTPPAGGNAYYILAHAWIAAELNLLDGASIPSEVAEAFEDSADLLASKTPEQVAKLKGKKRVTWVGLAYVLDEYNNGLTGPGHCSEEGG